MAEVKTDVLYTYGRGQAKSTVFFGKHSTFATTNEQPPARDDVDWVT